MRLSNAVVVCEAGYNRQFCAVLAKCGLRSGYDASLKILNFEF
jgi:hypothetical protein